jgi:hypothetical protein
MHRTSYQISQGGGFLFRLAKMEHPDNQRDSEKNRSAIQRPSAGNAQIRGLFGSQPKAEDFLATQGAGSGKFGVRIERKCAQEARTLCLCLPIPFQLRCSQKCPSQGTASLVTAFSNDSLHCAKSSGNTRG